MVTDLTQLVAMGDQAVIHAWGQVVLATGGDEGHYFRLCVLPSLSSVVLFWLLNMPLLVFNFFPWANPFERWKVQKGRYETKEKVLWMLAVVIFNQGLGMLISVSSWNYSNMEAMAISTGTTGLPTLWELCWQLFACCMLYDTIFFAVHCAMHTKWLYYTFHRVHHSSKVTIGISSAYFHPVDYILSAVAVLAPPQIVSDHIIVSTLWLIVFILETTNAHCGYDIPFLPSAKDHDFHHSHSNWATEKYRFVTMGAFGLVWDRVFGTRQPVLDWWASHPEGRPHPSQPHSHDHGKHA